MIDVLEADIAKHLSEELGASLFENSQILKILHGCVSSDLQWMIRDFGIKMVSVYDTQEFHKKFISNKELSLAAFWERYCQGMAAIEKADKKEL